MLGDCKAIFMTEQRLDFRRPFRAQNTQKAKKGVTVK